VTTYKALKVGEAKPGEWVAVYGIGGLGHVAVQYPKAMGLKVVAVDTVDEKLAAVRIRKAPTRACRMGKTVRKGTNRLH
jgi:D-arabinose 1-dehydrogenase-like Zn-dependent alcohol dehydrogenase